MEGVYLSSSRLSELAKEGKIKAFRAWPGKRWYIQKESVLEYQGQQHNDMVLEEDGVTFDSALEES